MTSYCVKEVCCGVLKHSMYRYSMYQLSFRLPAAKKGTAKSLVGGVKRNGRVSLGGEVLVRVAGLGSNHWVFFSKR